MSTSTSTSPRGTSIRSTLAPAIRGRRADPGPGQLDLGGQVRLRRRHRGRATRGSTAARSATVTKPSDARSSSCFLRLGITVSKASIPAGRGPAPTGPPGPPCGARSSAVVQSSAARPCRSSTPVRLVQPPAGDADAREQAQVRRLLEPVAAPVRASWHISHWAHTMGSASSGAAASSDVRLARRMDTASRCANSRS